MDRNRHGKRCLFLTGNKCLSETDGITSWAVTDAGDTAFGQCASGYKGSPQRQCTFSGNFGPISGTLCARTWASARPGRF